MYRVTWLTDRHGYEQLDFDRLHEARRQIEHLLDRFTHFDGKLAVTLEKQ